MSTELEKLLADDDQTSAKALEAKKLAEEQAKVAEEAKKKGDHLENIKKAIAEANIELAKKRKALKDPIVIEEEETPKIDFNDPNAKAWGKHIDGAFKPIADELAKEKEEIRSFALNEFLADKPELAADAEKLKKVMSTYEKIRTSSERTREGVILDLRKAYAAENADEILAQRDNARIDRARGDALFAAPAISSGSSSFRNEREAAPHLTQEDQLQLAKWGLSVEEWVKLKKNAEKKS